MTLPSDIEDHDAVEPARAGTRRRPRTLKLSSRSGASVVLGLLLLVLLAGYGFLRTWHDEPQMAALPEPAPAPAPATDLGESSSAASSAPVESTQPTENRESTASPPEPQQAEPAPKRRHRHHRRGRQAKKERARKRKMADRKPAAKRETRPLRARPSPTPS